MQDFIAWLSGVLFALTVAAGLIGATAGVGRLTGWYGRR